MLGALAEAGRVGTSGWRLGRRDGPEGNGVNIVRTDRRRCDKESGISWYADGTATEELTSFGEEGESTDFWAGGSGGCEILLEVEDLTVILNTWI